jgi:4-hydroxy-3-polyprenylbenzoate decarboxylase
MGAAGQEQSMPFRDLREYLACLEREGELTRVQAEVDWNLELGAISRRAMDRRAPALLFENIKGYPRGYSVLANILARSQQFDYSRFALSMDVPKDIGALELIEAFVQRMDRRIPPELVATGPCKENIVKGDEVNLLEFPVPLLKGPDGGRFIGTWHVNVTKDPETGWVNWGMYRHMVHDERTVGWLAPPVQHGPSLFYKKYEARNEPMPMAIVIGTEPISTIMAGTPLPANVSEVEAVGGLRGEPVELVRCETIDLEVPASAEIVLEGHVIPHERRLEGPFGEFTGYAAGDRMERPVFRVDCITYRNNPILTASNVGKPWEEESVMGSVTWSAALVDDLRKRGIYFKSLYVAPPLQAIIVSCDPPYPGYQQTLASAIWSSKFGINRAYIFIVGEDVDVTNIEDVWWCLTTRLHPVNGIHVQRNTNAFVLWPFISDEERRMGQGSKVYFDATFPSNWPKEKIPTTIDFKHGWPEEIQQRVLERWNELGIP